MTEAEQDKALQKALDETLEAFADRAAKALKTSEHKVAFDEVMRVLRVCSICRKRKCKQCRKCDSPHCESMTCDEAAIQMVIE